MTKRLAFAAGLALLLSSCTSRIVSHPIDQVPRPPDQEKVPMGGIVYTLPRTVVKVTVPVSRTTEKVATYGKYAKLFFPDRDAITEDTKSFRIQTPTFSVYGEPDPTQMYYVSVQDSSALASLKQVLTFQFSERGAVTGLKAEVTNATSDVVLAGVGAVSGILQRTTFGLSDADLKTLRSDDCRDSPDSVLGDVERQRKYFRVCFLGTPELVQNFDSLEQNEQNALIADFWNTNSQKRTDLDKAKAAYLKITGMLQKRDELLTSPVAGVPPELYDKADIVAKELLNQYFLGKESTTSWNAEFEIVPETCDDKRSTPCKNWQSKPLLAYGPTTGICTIGTADNPKPILNQFRGALPPPRSFLAPKPGDCPNAKHLLLAFVLDPDVQPVTKVAANLTGPKEAGLYFTIPAQMTVALEEYPGTGDRSEGTPAEHGATSLMVAQHGIITALPSSLGGKALTYDLQLYDSTGAIKSFTLTSEPLVTKEAVSAASTSANALLDARNRQIEAEKAAADQLNQLQRTRDLLDLQKEIRNICAAPSMGISTEDCEALIHGQSPDSNQ